MNPEIWLVLSKVRILLFLFQFCKVLAKSLIKSQLYSWYLAFAFFKFKSTYMYFAHATDWIK